MDITTTQATQARPKTWQVACADIGVQCGFLIRTHDRRELVQTVTSHARTTHGLVGIAEQDVLAKARPVD